MAKLVQVQPNKYINIDAVLKVQVVQTWIEFHFPENVYSFDFPDARDAHLAMDKILEDLTNDPRA